MKKIDTHYIIASFKEWLQHHVLKDLEAFTNVTDQELFLTPQEKRTDFRCYAAPSKQWIYDSSVTGAFVPDSAEFDGDTVGRTDGLIFDFENAQILVPEDNILEPELVTINYSLKEVNFYMSTMADEQLIFGEAQYMVPEYDEENPPQKGLRMKDIVAPACFVKYKEEKHRPYCLGGLIEKNYQIRTIFMLKNEHQLVGIGQLCDNLKNQCFGILSKTPLSAEFGDLKPSLLPEWSWTTANVIGAESNKIRVTDVVPSIIESDRVSQMHPDMFILIVDFYLSRLK